jgi:hypothetical protein
MPVQLRLLVLQELSPSPGCKSILEFSTRLALFERPGGANIIRGVYERFLRLPPRPAESVSASPEPAATPAAGPVPWWWTRPVRSAAAAAVLLVALGAAGAWLWRNASPPPPGSVDSRGPVARVVGDAGASVVVAASNGAKSVSRWIGLGGGTPVAAPAAGPLDASAPPEAAPSRRSARPAPKPAAPDAPAPDAVAPRHVASDTNVYSVSDVQVVPPSLVGSRLPSDPPPGVRADALPEVEVVVSATGEVESVKLLSPQAGVGPAMMLSAIKTWRFLPASRDGEPVRYRLRMRLTNR